MEKLSTEPFPFSSWLYTDCSCFIFPSVSPPDHCHFHEECPAHCFMKVKLFTERSLCLKRRWRMNESMSRSLLFCKRRLNTECCLSSERSGERCFPVQHPRLQGWRVGGWILEAVTRVESPLPREPPAGPPRGACPVALSQHRPALAALHTGLRQRRPWRRLHAAQEAPEGRCSGADPSRAWLRVPPPGPCPIVEPHVVLRGLGDV